MTVRLFAGGRRIRPLLLLLCAIVLHAPRADAGDTADGAGLKMPRIQGRIFIDGQTYNDTRSTIDSGLTVAHARLTLSGSLPRRWRYRFAYDFANRVIKYMWMRYDGFDPVHIMIGQYKEPFSLNEQTSTRFLTFIERALPNALVPGYHVGVGAQRLGGRWTAAMGVFANPTSGYTPTTPGSGSWALTGRLTWNPVHRRRALAHVGVGGTFRLAGDRHVLQVKEAPETGRTETYYLNTGQVDGVDHLATLGLEGAGVAGPWSVQGELMHTWVSRRRGLPSLAFTGAYAFVSWFPTGESRPYRQGQFRRVHPRHKAGALQLAARYSFLDLNSGPVAGGRERDATLGVNWYFSPFTRFMFDYIKVHARGGGRTENPNIFLARMQSDF